MLTFSSKLLCLAAIVLLVGHDLRVRQMARIYEGTLARTVRDNQLRPTEEPGLLDLDPMKDTRGWTYKLLDLGELVLLVGLAWLAGRFWTRTWLRWWLPRTQDRPSAN